MNINTGNKTDFRIRNNRPDIFILDKKKNMIKLIEVGITSQESFQKVEIDKLRNLIYKFSVEIISYLMTWDGIVTKNIKFNIKSNIQKIILKKTPGKSVNDAWETNTSLKQASDEQDNGGTTLGERTRNISKDSNLEEETNLKRGKENISKLYKKF
ncbi:hypothetical protein CWI38_0008p0150 [Hamiltosporidium tvaerminnensis]|uniref:Uncharacterized protein n=1 Tax=Hamiltosporidium tvaerminnensis TaxID=1176355 RepID=A0A4Q9M5A9_9MICR|nr:hypothetical protein CWI38_0008p0150 [Hamiltosporidium tvaerminnensis]